MFIGITGAEAEVPIVMYGCENWTMKKAERQRTDDAFELWC